MIVIDETTSALDRFESPLYTVSEAARYLNVPASTLYTWTRGCERRVSGRRTVAGLPVVTALPKTKGRGPVIPVHRSRRSPRAQRHETQRRTATTDPPCPGPGDRTFRHEPRSASKRLYTDGAEVLFDYANSGEDRHAAVAQEYGVPPEHLEDALRIAISPAS